MSLLTIVLFFVYMWGLGTSLTRWVQHSENFFERHIMRVGFGMGCFVMLGVLFNLVGIPIYWRYFLVFSLIIPLASLSVRIMDKNYALPVIQLTKTNGYIAVAFIIFLFSLYMYAGGAFSYPYLEDDDPWGHAEGAKYVAVEQTIETHVESLEERFKGVRFFGYLDPYPPGYDMLLGVLHQTAPSLSWTLKFFNALIISLGLLFFFFFMREFTQDSRKALFSMFVLALVPAYFTHFIWAHSLIVTLFFPAMYAHERIKQDKRWAIVVAVVFAGILLTQPSKIFKLVPMMTLYMLIRWVMERRFPTYNVLGMIGGAVLSLAWWFEKGKSMLSIKYAARVDRTAADVAQSTGLVDLILSTIRRLPEVFPPGGGSATEVYTFDNFFYAQPYGLINNSVGIGIVVYALLFVTTIFFLFWVVRHKKDGVRRGLRYASYGLLSVAGVTTGLLTIRYITLPFAPMLQSLKIDMVHYIIIFLLVLIAGYTGSVEIKAWHAIAFSWLVFTFLFVNSLTFELPIGLWAFRIWSLVALSTSMIVSEGLFGLVYVVKQRFPLYANQLTGAVLVAVILGIALTSGYQKYLINTSQWTPGGSWTSPDELQAYVWMKQNLPPNTKVFAYSARDQNIFGFDMYSCKWCPDIIEFRKKTLDYDARELHTFLIDKDYEYLIVDAMSVKYLKKYFGYNETVIQQKLPERLQEFAASGLFEPVHQTRGAVIFKVR